MSSVEAQLRAELNALKSQLQAYQVAQLHCVGGGSLLRVIMAMAKAVGDNHHELLGSLISLNPAYGPGLASEISCLRRRAFLSEPVPL